MGRVAQAGGMVMVKMGSIPSRQTPFGFSLRIALGFWSLARDARCGELASLARVVS